MEEEMKEEEEEEGKALETHVFDSFTDIDKSEEKCPTELLLNRKTPDILTHKNTALPYYYQSMIKLPWLTDPLEQKFKMSRGEMLQVQMNIIKTKQIYKP